MAVSILVAAFSAAAAAAVRGADLTAELNDLDALDTVESNGVGQGGTHSKFNKLGLRLLAKGTPADFERLAGDKVPVARAMGLYCLARSRAGRAVPVLRARATDAGHVYTTIGCMGGARITVGQLARHLLRDRNYFDFTDDGPEPLIPAAEVFAEDVTMLAADDPAARADLLEFGPAESVRDLLGWRKRVALDAAGLAAVQAHLPGVPRWRVVKGVGRAGPDPNVRAFLIARLHDQDEDPTARLAAASALTRDPDPAVVPAIRLVTGFLNATEAGRADRLVAAARLRAKLDPPRGEADKGGGLFGDPPADPPPELRASDHPMVLEYLVTAPNPFTSTEHQEIAAAQMARLARRVGEFGRRWDTYSDAVLTLQDAAGWDGNTDDADARAVRRDINRAIRARE